MKLKIQPQMRNLSIFHDHPLEVSLKSSASKNNNGISRVSIVSIDLVFYQFENRSFWGSWIIGFFHGFYFVHCYFIFLLLILTADEVISAIDSSKIEIFQRYVHSRYLNTHSHSCRKFVGGRLLCHLCGHISWSWGHFVFFNLI